MSRQELIGHFYSSFQQGDWKAMHDCYHNEIVFSDPVFGNLEGGRAKAMWHMLVTAAKDLRISFSNIRVQGESGSCDWEATYTFSKTGRTVHNRIHAEFRFANGKIVRHTDTFDLSRWAGMAFGAPGKLLGWTSWMKNKIKATAGVSLERFMKGHPTYLDRQNSPEAP